MNPDLQTFIEQARAKRLGDAAIKQRLLDAGWPAADVSAALTDDGLGLVVPVPPHPGLAVDQPKNPSRLSRYSLDYKMYFVVLLLMLIGVIWTLNTLISGWNDGTDGAYPMTLLLVSTPLTLLLFLRLRRAELTVPGLRQDRTRRCVVQAIQLLTFIGVIGHTIVLFYLVLSGHYTPGSSTSYGYVETGDTSGASNPSFPADLLRYFITLLVAGGVFWYYRRLERLA